MRSISKRGKCNKYFYLFIIIGVALVSLLLNPLSKIDAKEQNAEIRKKEQFIQVKLPDGLYLYHSSFKNLKNEVISPLVIVENGILVDPYDLENKTGIQNFMKEYIHGKEFTVYKGSEKYGKLSKISFYSVNKCKINNYTVPEFISDITGNGKYEGKTLYDKQPDRNETFGKIIEATRTIITPLSFQQNKNAIFLSLTEDDEKKMIGIFREKLLPVSMKQLNNFLKKRNKQIVTEDRSRLFVAEAIDLDGNGKKDFVGIYELVVKENEGGLSSISIPFVLWDTGKIEKITSSGTSEFLFIGAIDIDQDGIQELAVQYQVEVYREGLYTGRQIEIIQHSISGWKSIYKSKLICGPLSFYY